jgi:adenylosuccinate synthase
MTRGRAARVTRAVAVVDLGFGDAGKGLVTDHLVRATGSRMVVRFNGGAQAGHNVVTPDGRHHTFSQLGSGTFVPGVRTHLARRVVVHPTALLVEARRLADVGVPDALERVSVSPEALVTTPFHQAAGRLRELARGAERHGSCGVGVGEVMRDAVANPRDALRVEHLADGASLRPRLRRVQERLRASVAVSRDAARRLAGEAAFGELRALDDDAIVEAWIDAIRRFVATVEVAPDAALREAVEETPLVFEGAQGVLLDESHGFHPFTTWSNCTFDQAEELWGELGPDESLLRLGVVRAYAHRHGPGPLPTESPELAGALVERHNGDHPWQGPFRVGWPDLVLARYARDACRGVDGIAVTHLDAVARSPRWRAAIAYDGGRTTEWPAAPPADLDRRAGQARALARVAPQYVDVVDASPEARVRWIESAFGDAYGAPVLLYSYGPTSHDVRIDPA